LLLFLFLLLLWKLPYLQAKFSLLFFLCEISPRFTAPAVPLVSSKTNLPPKRSPHWTLLEVLKTRYLVLGFEGGRSLNHKGERVRLNQVKSVFLVCFFRVCFFLLLFWDWREKKGRKKGRKEILILWILGRWLGFRLLVCVGKRRGRELWMVSMAKMPQSWEVEEER
jgi:hypothetical protein